MLKSSQKKTLAEQNLWYNEWRVQQKKSYQLEVTGMYTEYKRALIRCNVMKERRQTGLELEIDMENIDGFEIRSVFE